LTKTDNTYGPTYDTNKRDNTLDTDTYNGISYAITYGPGRGYLCGYVFIDWPLAGVWREYSHIALDILARPPYAIDMVKNMGEYVVIGFTGRFEGSMPIVPYMDQRYQEYWKWVCDQLGRASVMSDDPNDARTVGLEDMRACCEHIIDQYLESLN